MRSRASTLLLEFPSVFSENRIVRWATRKRLSLIRQWRRRFGTAKIANSKVHPKRDSEWPKCISQELQLAQQEETPRTQRHSLMFHYRVLAVWEASLLSVVVAI